MDKIQTISKMVMADTVNNDKLMKLAKSMAKKKRYVFLEDTMEKTDLELFTNIDLLKRIDVEKLMTDIKRREPNVKFSCNLTGTIVMSIKRIFKSNIFVSIELHDEYVIVWGSVITREDEEKFSEMYEVHGADITNENLLRCCDAMFRKCTMEAL